MHVGAVHLMGGVKENYKLVGTSFTHVIFLYYGKPYSFSRSESICLDSLFIEKIICVFKFLVQR